MRAAALPLLSILLVAALLASTPNAFAKGEAPTLTAGDFFDARTTTTTSGVTVTATSHSVVQSAEQIAVGGISYDAWKIVTTTVSNTTSAGFTSATTTTTTSWARTSDGASLKTTSSSTTTTDVPGLGPQTTTGTSETTYTKPCAQYQWPLVVAAHWATDCTFTTTTVTNGVTNTASGSTHSNTTVDGTESITVPAGTFETFALTVTFNDASTGSNATTKQWFAPNACTSAKSTGGSAPNVVTSELTGGKCAATGFGVTTSTTTTTTSSTTSTSTSTTTSTTPTGETSTTTTQETSTTSTTPAPAGKTGVPGPAIGLVLATIAAAAVLVVRRRA